MVFFYDTLIRYLKSQDMDSHGRRNSFNEADVVFVFARAELFRSQVSTTSRCLSSLTGNLMFYQLLFC